MSVTYILGISTDPADPAKLALGSTLLWSVADGDFKAVLIETSDPAAQQALMVDWREATGHPLRGMAEEMMADRLECLRGKTVRYRSLWSDGEKFDATVTLVRLDELAPGDTFWVPDLGPVTATRTFTNDVETEITGADRWETIADARLRLVALVSRNDGRPAEQRFVALPGGRSGREDWLSETAVAEAA